MASRKTTFNRTSPPSSTRRENGTRKLKVPCDDCIQRATEDTGTLSIQLCESCMRLLHRPRRKQHQAPNIGKIRRRSSAIIDTVLGLNTKPMSLPWSDDRQVQHSLQFFVQHSAPQLVGYFDSPFWQRILLKSGQHCPAVKHAIAAIGALHERLLTGGDCTDGTYQRNSKFAFEQCNQSIQHLTKPVDGKQPGLNLMLTTCVLFTCFDAMQGHCEQAISHAKQGYALLKQYAADPRSTPCETSAFAVELDQLCLVMQRLQTQSKGLMRSYYHPVGEDDARDLPKPVYFEKLRDARIALELIINRLSIYFLDLDLDDEFYKLMCDGADDYTSTVSWLKAWEEAFAQLLVRAQDSLTPIERRGGMILKAHHLVCEILSTVDLSKGELAWDEHHVSFTAIVNLAEAVLQEYPQPYRMNLSDSSISPKTQLCFSLSIVDPLYEVCARCRDPSLRRRALDLLARHPGQGCMWGSWSGYKVDKYLIQLEEEEEGRSPRLLAPDAGAADSNPFDFSEQPVGGNESIGLRMHKHMSAHHSPRKALNPGLFASHSSEDSGQDFDFTCATTSV